MSDFNVLTVSYTSANAKQLFTKSLKETGFAVLKNHPVSQELILKTFEDWKTFFESKAKFKYQFDPKMQAGYFPFRSENARNYSAKDLKEFFHVYPWYKLPDELPNRTWELYAKLSELAAELLGWIQDETPEEVKKHFSMPLNQMIQNSQDTLLRPIHYPPLSGTEENGAIRAAAHEDINLITLLPAASAPGLQVKDTQGNWLDVPCDLGSIVVNVGDMLQMASKGYYRSTTHQVINPKEDNSSKPRYSMPLFLHPRGDVKLSEEYTAGSYLSERVGELGLRSERSREKKVLSENSPQRSL